MKKSFKFLALAAAAAVCAVSLVSCNGDKKDDGPKYAPLSKPANTDVATKVSFSGSGLTLPSGRSIKSIEFTETERAIITEELIPRSSDAAANVIVTTYTFSGGEYTVKGFGKVKIASASAKVTITEEKSSESVTGDASVESSSQVGKDNNLFREWKIVEATVKADGPRVAVEMTFKHGDLYKIAQWLKDNDVDIDIEELKGYNVKGVQFTKAGSFYVYFEKADTFVGDFSLIGEKFHYDLQLQDGNSLLNGSADGSIKVDDPKCYVVVNGEVAGSKDKWTTEIKLTLVDVNA